MRLVVLLVTLLGTGACATSVPLEPSEGPWRFSGTVLATDGVRVGAPIPGAHLTVVSGANTAATVTSDAVGHYAFESLESGRFTISIAAPGYVSVTPVVALFRDMQVDFALQPQ